MKLGINDGYLIQYGEKTGLKRMKSHGFTCLDYQGLIHTEDPIFAEPEESFRKILEQQRQDAADAGITVWQVHGPWQWPAADATPEQRARRYEYYAKAVRGTAYLGAEYFVIHPLMPYGAKDENAQAVWEINTEFYSRLLKVAEEYRVTVCLENMPFTEQSLASPEAVLQFVKSFRSPRMRMCLDTGHCAVFGMQPGKAVRLLGKEYLKVLHIHDNDGSGDLHWLPYTGWIDWEDFARSLQEIGFDGCVSLETEADVKNKTDAEAEAAQLKLAADLKKIACAN